MSRASRRAAWLGGLVWVLLVAGVLGAPPLRNVDWGWQLQTGERILTEGTVHLPDTFTVAGEGRSIPPIHWLYEVGLASVHRAGGIHALVALRFALVVALYGLLYALATRQGLPPLVAALASSAAASASWLRLVLRPHVVSFLFTVALVGMLLESRRQPRWLFAVPVLFAVWANLHPGAILGVGVLGAFAAGELLRKIVFPRWRGEAAPDWVRPLLVWGGLVVASALATTANPSGPELWTWIWHHRGMFAGLGVTELRPFDFAVEVDRIYLATAVGLLLLGGRRLMDDPAPGLAAVFFLALALQTTRFFPHAEHLLVLAVAATWSREAVPRTARWVRSAVLLGLVCLTFWGARGVVRLPRELLYPGYHVPAVADFVLETDPPGPIYNSNQLGGYLVYRLANQRRVFWDGRPSLYTELWGLPWSALDERFRFGTVILAEGDPPLAPELPAARDRWRLVYFDDHARVYVDVGVADGAWADRGFRNVRLDWTRVRSGALLLVPAIGDPEAALAELEQQHTHDPDGYYTQLAVAHANLALGRLAAAGGAAEKALARRDTLAARAALAAAH